MAWITSKRPFPCLACVDRYGGACLLLGVFSFVLFFYRLGAGDFYRTESLRAILAAEFLQGGNWIVPRLYGEPLLTKPPGMYAAIALASWPMGQVTEWSARLPSALAATVMVFLFYWYFRRHLGARGGLVAALSLPLSLMWLDKASSAEIDMLQTAWVTGAVLCFLRALEVEEGSERQNCSSSRDPAWGWWLAALGCVAGGVLTKWTAPVFFYGTVLPLLWWRGQLRLLWGRRHLLSVALAGGICLAWAAAAVWLAGGDTFYRTVSQEALVRLSARHHEAAARHEHLVGWQAVAAHPMRVWAASLPVSAFALVALWPGFACCWDKRTRRLLQALHCWVWPGLLFWSVIPEKAVRHSLPLAPGIAGLAALVWWAWLSGRLTWPVPRLAPSRVFAGILGVWLCVKLAVVHAVIPQRSREHAPRAKGEQLAEELPPGHCLYLFRLKDEGLMFYARAPARRLPDPAHLPRSYEPLYCILEEAEWRAWPTDRPAQAIMSLRDEQGAPIVLVRVAGRGPTLATSKE
jgi:4-amino-4-deoxy-L-arabinose transferase-like glycosyltransferase